MTYLPCLSRAALAASLTLAAAMPAQAAPVSAAPEDAIAFFIGEWATGPAPVEGYETLDAASPDCSRTVRIARGPDDGPENAIVRTVTESTVAFRVMQFAGNHPWWPVEGGSGPVARRVDADSFDLAPTAMGRADWGRAIRHYRCAAAPAG